MAGEKNKRVILTKDKITDRVLQNGLYVYKHKNGNWYSASGEELTNFKSTSGSNTLKKVSNKPIEALRNLIKENKKPIINEEQPITLKEVVVIGKSKPKSTTSRGTVTPTPTTGRRYGARSIDDAFSHYNLSDNHRKYLDSLNVGNDINKLLGILNVKLDSLWGDKTNEAFLKKYDEWKTKQTAPTERPLPTFDLNQEENWFRQYMLQPLRQPILAMPATYDRYDIRHWLKENNIKGITAGGRKALRHYLNGEDYDTRYLGIVDLYAPMIRGNQQQLTPAFDPEWLDFLNNMMGQSYLNLGNTGSSDDMYLFSDGSNLSRKTTSTPNWRPNSWTNKAQELGNQFKFTPSSSFLKKGGYIPKFQTAWGTITDMRNYIPSQNQTPNLPGSVAVAKATTRQKNNENRRKTRIAGAKDMSKKNIMDLLDLLWLKGFFEGTGFTYDQAVDGIIGRRTRQAMKKAKNSGYTVTLGLKMKRTPSLKQSQNKKEVNKEESSATRTPSEDIIGSTLDYLFPSRIRKREEEEALRNSINFDAVRRAKAHNNVKEPYWYFDPKDNVAYRMLGDRILDKFEIGSGLNLTSDGFTNLVGGYNRSKNLSSTGAGVFTLLKAQNAYLYNNEPVYLFRTADGKFTNQAWHGAATPERKLLLGDGNERNNKVSFGCIYGPDGVLRCFDENGQVNSGDSAYIEPKLDENYFYYDMNDGKIKTHFENMPSRVRGKNYNAKYDLNNVRYNTSY